MSSDAPNPRYMAILYKNGTTYYVCSHRRTTKNINLAKLFIRQGDAVNAGEACSNRTGCGHFVVRKIILVADVAPTIDKSLDIPNNHFRWSGPDERWSEFQKIPADFIGYQSPDIAEWIARHLYELDPDVNEDQFPMVIEFSLSGSNYRETVLLGSDPTFTAE